MQLVKSSQLQALIITKNEDSNITRVLDKLTWLEKVLVLDSYSIDNTNTILKSYPNVEIAYRDFDSFASQCNYGLSLISSKWVLSLDADYVLTDKFIEETINLISKPQIKIVAYNTRFEFLVFGKQLLSNITTARPVLFKIGKGLYVDDGHAHRLKINGNIGSYKNLILHDDRKALSRWINNQNIYSVNECKKLLSNDSFEKKSVIDKIRKTKVFAPFLVFFIVCFLKD